ncbi:transcriptional regulator domain-containing protein [Sphingomonas gei]|uniref:transcriptional regulator domain-containing protein n=1 Tax=Sphingomonas gei TaxID=1395960 RepID=UPI003B8359E6
MWEWLRRDPSYVAWYTRASTATRGASGLAPGADPVLWGIHFRRAAGGRGPRRADPLACRFRSGDAPRRRGTHRARRSRCDRSRRTGTLADDRARRAGRACCAVGWLAPYPARCGAG